MDVSLLAKPEGNVVVVGGGRAGLAAVQLLLDLGVEPLVVDDAPADAVAERVGALQSGGRVRVQGGGFSASDLSSASLLVLSPGVPRVHPAVAAALEAGVAVVNEVELGMAQLEGCSVLAITGTNGKSTTATLAGSIATVFDQGAFVGGNLGKPLCEAVVEGARPRLAVLELSSYQLETIRNLRVQAAVVTNLSPDHLDRYPSVDAYYDAKARLFDLVTPGGGISLNRSDAISQHHFDAKAKGLRLDFDVLVGTEGVSLDDGPVARVRTGPSEEKVALDNPHLLGHHNYQNAMAAIAGAALCGVPPDCWREGINTYAGIAHRMETVGEVAGVRYINDSKATTVDAAVKAVMSFERGVHLIAGGVGKGAPYEPLVEAARGRVERVYTIGADGPRIAAAFAGACPVEEVETLGAAIEAARARAQAGDTVLMAPACASFDQFKNYGARGEAFRAHVERIAKGEGSS